MYATFAKLCEERGVTAYQISKETGIPSSTFTEWKNGKYQPKVEKIMEIAKFFNVPLETFYKGKA